MYSNVSFQGHMQPTSQLLHLGPESCDEDHDRWTLNEPWIIWFSVERIAIVPIKMSLLKNNVARKSKQKIAGSNPVWACPAFWSSRRQQGLWRNGNASAYGAEDSRFDPWQPRLFFDASNMYHVFVWIWCHGAISICLAYCISAGPEHSKELTPPPFPTIWHP